MVVGAFCSTSLRLIHTKRLETIKETAEQRRAQARLLRAKGLSWKEVGKEMGISANAAWLLAYR